MYEKNSSQNLRTATIQGMTDESIELQTFTESPKSPMKNNQRPDIRAASKVITERYGGTQTLQKEAILFIFLFINLLNQWFNYDILVVPNHTSYFWTCMAIEWSISIYYVYDGFHKLKSPLHSDLIDRNQFSVIQVLSLVCGPFQIILDIIYFIQFGHLYWLSMFLRSLKPITSNYQAQLLDDINFSFVKTIPLFFSTTIIFFIFSYLFTIFYSDMSRTYFVNIGNSALTLLQIVTFDGWGDITRHLYDQSGILIIIFMFFFITIIAFYFFYLIQAFQIDVIILEAAIKQNQCKLDKQLSIIRQDTDLMKELLVNLYYKRIVIIIAVIQFVYANNQDNLCYANDDYFVLFNILVAMLYFFHYILISTLNEHFFQNVQVYSRIQMIFHFLAGPCAFILILCIFFTVINSIDEFTYLQYIRFGPALLLFKLFTNQTIRDISQIQKKIIPLSVAPYLCMLGLTFLTAFIMSYFYARHIEEWFDQYAYSILTYFQVITLDDWAGGLAQNLMDHGMYFSFFFIFIFMVITNYILIPAFVAQTCELFSYILGVSFVPRLKQEHSHITFFSHKFKLTNGRYAEDQEFEINYNDYTLNQHVKSVIVKLLQNKSTIFKTPQPPQVLKDIFKSILKSERTIKHRFQNITQKEVQLLETLQKVQQIDKKPEIYIKYKNQFILVDEFNSKYLKQNVKPFT